MSVSPQLHEDQNARIWVIDATYYRLCSRRTDDTFYDPIHSVPVLL